MTRTGPRAVPAVLLALLFALAAGVVPAWSGPHIAQTGRVVTAVHTQAVGSAGQPTHTRVTLAAAHPDGAGAGGGADGAGEPASTAGLTIALAALGLAVLVVMRGDGRLAPPARGRSPPRVAFSHPF
jgi:hypothetical protein